MEGVNLTKEDSKHIQKCHKETPTVQVIYTNENV
jgi:hypothetical protein